MRRRDFIKIIAGTAASWPLTARAQQPDRVRRIGVLMGYPENDLEGPAFFAAFREGLQKLGWVEGRNIRLDTRWVTPEDGETRQRFAKELVGLQPDLILSSVTPTTAALLEQTRTIPIVFATVSDPVGSGFVASLARPGGNVTGFQAMVGSLAGKWLELLKEIAPRVTRVAMLFNPAVAPYAESFLNPLKAAASSLAVETIEAPVRDLSELESVVAAQARQPNGGLIVIPDIFTDVHCAEIISLAARSGLPACEKSEHPSPPLNHPKSDSYAAPTAERRSAGSGISNPEGSGPSPGCRPEAFPVRPPRRDRNPDRLPSWATRQRALRIDLEYDRA